MGLFRPVLVLAGAAALIVWGFVASSSADGPRCFGQPASVVGSPDSDDLTGTAGADVIVGLGGIDTIRGGGGQDRICGGTGVDMLLGQAAVDHLQGGPGNDVLTGGSAADLIVGSRPGTADPNAEDAVSYVDKTADLFIDVGAGVWPDGDRVRRVQVIGTGEGSDTVVVDDTIRLAELAGGDDHARVTAGTALLSAGNGDDRLMAGADGNSLSGGAGIDELVGGVGNDNLLGTHGSTFLGNAGDDEVFIDGSDNAGAVTVVRAGAGDDRIQNSLLDDDIDGGSGADLVEHGFDFSPPRAVTIDLLAGTATGWGTDVVLQVEHVSGSSAADVIRGSHLANELAGGLGSDVIVGRGGHDRLAGGADDDDLRGGDGDDRLDGGAGTDAADGGAGVDTCVLVETVSSCEAS